MSRRPDRDPEDAWNQDRYVSEDEERFAAEMGQPSDLPHERHGPPGAVRKVVEYFDADDRRIGGDHVRLDSASVLCQSSVRCSRCDRMTVPMEDVLVLDSEGNWAHAECGGDVDG